MFIMMLFHLSLQYLLYDLQQVPGTVTNKHRTVVSWKKIQKSEAETQKSEAETQKSEAETEMKV